MIQVDFDLFKEHKRNLYDTSWNFLEAEILYPSQKEHVFEKPEKLDELLTCAAKLGAGFREVRTDFYIVQNHIYLGEMTFFHGGGTESFSPSELGLEMGGWIDLSM